MEITHTLDLGAAAQQARASGVADEVPVPIAINLATLAIPSPGRYAIEIFLDGSHLRTMPVVFHLPPETT